MISETPLEMHCEYACISFILISFLLHSYIRAFLISWARLSGMVVNTLCSFFRDEREIFHDYRSELVLSGLTHVVLNDEHLS